MKGIDLDQTTCSQIPSGSYVTVPCNPGSSTSLGNDLQTSRCNTEVPQGGSKWISRLCDVGSLHVTGSDQVITFCSTPTKDQYIKTPCDPGTLTRLGSDAIILSACPVGNFYDNTARNVTQCTPCTGYKSSTRGSEYCNICQVGDYMSAGTPLFSSNTYLLTSPAHRLVTSWLQTKIK